MKPKAPEQGAPSVDRHCEDPRALTRGDEAIQGRRAALRSPGLLRRSPSGTTGVSRRPVARNDASRGAKLHHPFVAIGVGCRAGVAGEAIAALARRALAEAGAPSGERRMFTLAAKAGEPGLIEAARLLGVVLTPLPLEALQEQEQRIATPSPAARKLFGAPNIAEAAALAGAGAGGRLLSPRLAADGATCAVALSSEPR
jgi:cobalt-precorrin 5A hydrolase